MRVMGLDAIQAGAAAVLRQHPEVRLAVLFGSHATGRARADSDVDIAIEAARGADVLEVAAELSVALGREVDVVRLDDAGVPLLEALVRDGVVLHEARSGIAARWRSHALASLETDRPWFERMRDAWLRRVALRGIGDGRS